jgi:hypothetical protein
MEFLQQVLCPARDGDMAIHWPASDAGFIVQGHR